MKRLSGLGSGMSYSAKKTVWKWTPAKIAAFSMFGVMMAALLYFESTSTRSTYEPVLVQEQRRAEPSITDFEKEYEEFLKKGTKIVSQETLDSLNAIENNSRSQTSVEPPSRSNTENSITPVATEKSTTRPQNRSENRSQASNAKGASNTAVDPEPLSENVENHLQTVEEIPTPKNHKKEDLIGVLEEVSPEDYNAIVNKSRSKERKSAQVITEEFFVEETISGRIYALSDGTPLAGVSVSVQGTDISTSSDSGGRYTITVPGDPEHRTIRYSYQGNSTERDVDPGTSVLNIRF